MLLRALDFVMQIVQRYMDKQPIINETDGEMFLFWLALRSQLFIKNLSKRSASTFYFLKLEYAWTQCKFILH